MRYAILLVALACLPLQVSADGYHWSPHQLTITSVGGNGDVWKAVYLGLNDGTFIRLTQTDARNLIQQLEASLVGEEDQ